MSLSDLVRPPKVPARKAGRKAGRKVVLLRMEESRDEETRAAAAERMRKLHADPEFTARRLAAIREAKRNARGGALTAPIKRSRNGKRG